MDHRLIQQTSQKLVLSPQIRQYIKLLQMPAADLAIAINDLISENPVVEVQGEEALNLIPSESSPLSEPRKEIESQSRELEFGKSEDHERLLEIADSGVDTSPFRDSAFSNAEEAQQIKDFQDMILSRPESLEEELFRQIRTLDFSEQERKAAQEFVGDLDEKGYLSSSLEEIAHRTGLSLELAAQLLTKLQDLDPAGIFARDLQECLLIQLHRMQPVPQLAMEMIRQSFGLVAKHDWAGIAKQMQKSVDEIRSAFQIIAQLEPRPSRFFQGEAPQDVVPDVTVSFDDTESGQLRVELRQENIPRLKISRLYRKMLRDPQTDAETRRFIREKIQNAMNFIQGMEMRGSTLKNLAEFIVKSQPDFFTQGFSHLRPLRMKDAAEALKLHESSISRAVNGKYMATPQGTVPLRSFFSSRLETSEGEGESQRSLLVRIQKMISEEDPKHPLSDQALVDQLKSEGVQIARRTVTKYRELLKILPTHLRKQR